MQRRIDVGPVKKKRTRHYVLADLFHAVRMECGNDLEAIVVIAHLLEHARVRFTNLDPEVQVRIC